MTKVNKTKADIIAAELILCDMIPRVIFRDGTLIYQDDDEFFLRTKNGTYYNLFDIAEMKNFFHPKIKVIFNGEDLRKASHRVKLIYSVGKRLIIKSKMHCVYYNQDNALDIDKRKRTIVLKQKLRLY